MIRLIQIGLGPVGQMLTPFLVERNSLKIVGAVDVDPALAGKDLGEASKLQKKIGIPIRKSLAEFKSGDADVAVVTTVSKLMEILPTIEDCAKLGLDVVSTCEELVYPWTREPQLSTRIDETAKRGDVSIVSTGVNPGFLMDTLAILSTAICRSVDSIRIERIQDAGQRRVPFQKKVGTGMTVEEFRGKVESGKLGHVGLTESMQMIAARMGWKLDRTEDVAEPVVAERPTPSGLGEVPKGKVIGLVQHGRAWSGSKGVLTLLFRAAVGEKESYDSIHVNGTPDFTMKIAGGIHGDIATCAITTNAIPFVVDAPAGLRTMIDLPPLSFRP